MRATEEQRTKKVQQTFERAGTFLLRILFKRASLFPEMWDRSAERSRRLREAIGLRKRESPEMVIMRAACFLERNGLITMGSGTGCPSGCADFLMTITEKGSCFLLKKESFENCDWTETL